MKPSTLLFQSYDTTENLIRNETVRDLVHRHLSDPNHIITDDEIRNARITSSVNENTDNLPQNGELDPRTSINSPTI